MADSVYLVGNFRAPDQQTVINGSYLVDRDFNTLSAQVNDPNGDRDYALACRYQYVETRMCKHREHRGERWLPTNEFVGNSETCIGCERRVRLALGETERSMRLKRAKPLSFWRAMHERGT